MIYNCFEEQTLRNSDLPFEWRGKEASEELEFFLQQNWDARHAFFNDECGSTKQQFLSFRNGFSARTNNYVGTIVFKGQQLNIFPKMFRTDRDDRDATPYKTSDLMRNLVQWLEFCTKIDYPYLSVKSDLSGCDDLRELFVTLFVRYLNAAFSRGFYHQYTEKHEDLPFVKGKFEASKYITRNYATGRANLFPCEYSEFELDNEFNQIIKYVSKLLIREASERNKVDLRKIVLRLSDVSDRHCSVRDCDKIRISKMHKRYEIILAMCRMFLLNKTTSMEIGTADSFCFLFPTELLFEGFIGGFISSMLEGKGQVKLQSSDECLVNDVKYFGKSYGPAFTMRHDIVCELNGSVFLMDTKYKMIDRFEEHKDDEAEWKYRLIDGVKQTDLYQITTYAVKRNLNKAYLIYPLFNKEDLESEIPVLEELHVPRGAINLSDLKIVDIYLLRVPFVFESNPEITKGKLKKALEKIFA